MVQSQRRPRFKCCQPCSVTSGKSFNLPVPQFSRLHTGVIIRVPSCWGCQEDLVDGGAKCWPSTVNSGCFGYLEHLLGLKGVVKGKGSLGLEKPINPSQNEAAPSGTLQEGQLAKVAPPPKLEGWGQPRWSVLPPWPVQTPVRETMDPVPPPPLLQERGKGISENANTGSCSQRCGCMPVASHFKERLCFLPCHLCIF
jgi:hypothetical protein